MPSCFPPGLGFWATRGGEGSEERRGAPPSQAQEPGLQVRPPLQPGMTQTLVSVSLS